MTALPSERCRWYFDISIDKIPMEQRIQAIKMFERAINARVRRDYVWYIEHFRLLYWNAGLVHIESSWSSTRKPLDNFIRYLKSEGYKSFTDSITLGEL